MSVPPQPRKGLLESISRFASMAFIPTARWIGLAGVVYGAITRNPVVVYGCLGLLASPYVVGGRG